MLGAMSPQPRLLPALRRSALGRGVRRGAAGVIRRRGRLGSPPFSCRGAGPRPPRLLRADAAARPPAAPALRRPGRPLHPSDPPHPLTARRARARPAGAALPGRRRSRSAPVPAHRESTHHLHERWETMTVTANESGTATAAAPARLREARAVDEAVVEGPRTLRRLPE